MLVEFSYKEEEVDLFNDSANIYFPFRKVLDCVKINWIFCA